jgi:hypothetical protein
VRCGQTLVLTEEQAPPRLVDIVDTSTVDGVRDRALIDVMTYALPRIGAVATARTRTQTGRLRKQPKHRLLPVLRVETRDEGGNMPWKGIGVALAIIVAFLIVLGRASGVVVDWERRG